MWWESSERAKVQHKYALRVSRPPDLGKNVNILGGFYAKMVGVKIEGVRAGLPTWEKLRKIWEVFMPKWSVLACVRAKQYGGGLFKNSFLLFAKSVTSKDLSIKSSNVLKFQSSKLRARRWGGSLPGVGRSRGGAETTYTGEANVYFNF
jgi:hypothetical protein